MSLSDGTTIDEWVRKVQPLPPEPPPGPTMEEIRLARIETALMEFGARIEGIQISAPEVRVEAPDLSEIVQAVAGIKVSDPQAIARALAPLLVPQQAPDLSILGKLAEKLEQLDFRMKGAQPAFGASGPSNISDNETRKLGVVKSITDPVATKAAPTEERFDYDVRTDANPVYVGSAAPGTLTSAASWTVFKFTYDASNRATRKQRQDNITWDARNVGW